MIEIECGVMEKISITVNNIALNMRIFSGCCITITSTNIMKNLLKLFKSDISTTNSKKIALVDVTNIDSPSVLFTETTVGRPEAGIFWNGKTVIPCGYQGLLVEK